LTYRGEPTSGKKDDLLARVHDSLRRLGLLPSEQEDGMDVDGDEEEDVKPKASGGGSSGKSRKKVKRVVEESEDEY
jgi:hypothetical protein